MRILWAAIFAPLYVALWARYRKESEGRVGLFLWIAPVAGFLAVPLVVCGQWWLLAFCPPLVATEPVFRLWLAGTALAAVEQLVLFFGTLVFLTLARPTARGADLVLFTLLSGTGVVTISPLVVYFLNRALGEVFFSPVLLLAAAAWSVPLSGALRHASSARWRIAVGLGGAILAEGLFVTAAARHWIDASSVVLDGALFALVLAIYSRVAQYEPECPN